MCICFLPPYSSLPSSLQEPGKAPKIEEAKGAQPRLRKVALVVKLMKLMEEAKKGRPEALLSAQPPVRGGSSWLLHD